MSTKILTVDDSKTVRIIIKKAFKNHDVEIAEAADGEQGLEAAKEFSPEIILLDVTMPVMDGVEMLTKLKDDVKLKHIPVIMLTAEAGKENVMKIARIGVRDYIIKPFKEGALVEKVKRVVDLKEKTKERSVPKYPQDPCDVLVVEDKFNIVDQIKTAVSASPWNCLCASNYDEAVAFCETTPPHVAILSLSLPDEATTTIYRYIRSNEKTKDIRIIGMSVKGADSEQKAAREVGIASFLYKPLNDDEVYDALCRCLKLDVTVSYFKPDSDCLLVSLPKKLTGYSLQMLVEQLPRQVSNAVNNGLSKVIFDIQAFTSLELEVVKLFISAAEACEKVSVDYVFVAKPEIQEECTVNYEETKNWIFCTSIDEAKSVAAPAT